MADKPVMFTPDTAKRIMEFVRGGKRPPQKRRTGSFDTTRDRGGSDDVAGLIAVVLEEDGSGFAGDGATMCSFSYTVKTWDGTTTIDTGVSPFDGGERFETGEMIAATGGWGFDTPDGFVLLGCNEKKTTTACAASMDGGTA
jgi:hypothetical protein